MRKIFGPITKRLHGKEDGWYDAGESNGPRTDRFGKGQKK